MKKITFYEWDEENPLIEIYVKDKDIDKAIEVFNEWQYDIEEYDVITLGELSKN